MKAWYLLYCKPREEIRAQKNFELQKIETYFPMLTEKKIQKGKKVKIKTALFPNYLFVYFNPEVTSVSSIRSTRGVSQLVDCREKMTPLCHLVVALRDQEGKQNFEKGNVDLRNEQQDKVVDIPEFQPGEKIRFTEGPFADLEGVFQQKNGVKRCHVLLNILGQMKKTKVPLSSIASVKAI